MRNKWIVLMGLVISLLVLVACTATPKSEKKIICAIELHSLNNPYYVTLKEGAEMFVESLPEGTAELRIMLSENDDQKEIENIKALIEDAGQDAILFIDPNQAQNLETIASLCEENGIYWSAVWSTAKDVYPTNHHYYTLYQAQDDKQAGYDISVKMFDSFDFPARGKILALRGTVGNSADINRFSGLKKALEAYPEVRLIESRSGEWNSERAYMITKEWLNSHEDIDGIWCANDAMALAAIRALKEEGLNKQVKVVGINAINDAIKALKSGDLLATVSSNGWMQAFYGLAYPYAAYSGDLNTSQMTADESMIYTPGYLVTQDTVGEYEDQFIYNKPTYDYRALETCVGRPMDIDVK